MVQNQDQAGKAKAEQNKAEKLEKAYTQYAYGIITREEYEEKVRKIEAES